MKLRYLAVPASLTLLLSACVVPFDADYDDDYRPQRPRRHESRQYEEYVPRPEQDRDFDREERRNRYDRARGDGGAYVGNQRAAHYSCENGSTVNLRREGDALYLTLDNKQARLHRTSSASGERYVGNSGLFGSGAEWHEKSGDAYFSFKDPSGNRVDTTCQPR